jgi:hypothetical protein
MKRLEISSCIQRIQESYKILATMKKSKASDVREEAVLLGGDLAIMDIWLTKLIDASRPHITPSPSPTP